MSKTDSMALRLQASSNESDEEVIARASLSPGIRAGQTISTLPHQLPGTDLTSLVNQLAAEQAKVRDNDLGIADDTLVAQAQTLDALFHTLTMKATNALDFDQFSACLKLALKAQNQSRATLATLANIKNPGSVAFVRQANIGQAVQVNNGLTHVATTASLPQSEHTSLQSLGGETFYLQNELLGVANE